ncbi:MAG: riboflavin biosynthesis protein RibF [Atopobiaceae bacterium]|nr:riboflavin biosynthesis protein RibF [Atopobiaceae bacterium]
MRVFLPAELVATLEATQDVVPRGFSWQEGPMGSRCLLLDGLRLGPGVNAVIAIGAFDGFHVGHRHLLDEARKDAKKRGALCLAVMFEPDPEELFLGASAPRRLLSCEDRARIIASAGADGVVMLHFDQTLAAMEPDGFVRQVLFGVCRPVSVHVGGNFRFGHQGRGDQNTLRICGRSEGFEVVVHGLLNQKGSAVSSTRIRSLLGEPEGLAEANELLGRCHFLRGVVEHGRGEGTTFGFPTANVRFPGLSCMPAQGVYAGFVTLGSSAWPAAINVGAPPTFSSPDELFCEANLIGFSGNAYDADVCVTFVRWLRASRPFSSLEELERVVLVNIDWVRTHLGDGAHSLGGGL